MCNLKHWFPSPSPPPLLSPLLPSLSLSPSPDDYPLDQPTNPIALGHRWLALTETKVSNILHHHL